MKSARRRGLAAVSHMPVGTDQVQAFGLGAIAVMERAFGIENE